MPEAEASLEELNKALRNLGIRKDAGEISLHDLPEINKTKNFLIHQRLPNMWISKVERKIKIKAFEDTHLIILNYINSIPDPKRDELNSALKNLGINKDVSELSIDDAQTIIYKGNFLIYQTLINRQILANEKKIKIDHIEADAIKLLDYIGFKSHPLFLRDELNKALNNLEISNDVTEISVDDAQKIIHKSNDLIKQCVDNRQISARERKTKILFIKKDKSKLLNFIGYAQPNPPANRWKKILKKLADEYDTLFSALQKSFQFNYTKSRIEKIFFYWLIILTIIVIILLIKIFG